MEEDLRNRGASRIKLAPGSIICVCLLLALSGMSSASQDDTGAILSVTEDAGPKSSSERTSNAIPEAEESTLDALKKYGTKKSESTLVSDQLEKPYPYYKSQSQGQGSKKAAATDDRRLDNEIRQTKRSGGADLLALNGTLRASVSELSSTSTSTSDSASASTTPETETQTETEATSEPVFDAVTEAEMETETETEPETTTGLPSTTTTTCQPSETTAFEDDDQDVNWSILESTTPAIDHQTNRVPTQNTQRTSNPPTPSEKSTESNAPFTSTDENSSIKSTTPTPSTTLMESTMPATTTMPTTILTTNRPEESTTEAIDVLPTSTELTTTTTTAAATAATTANHREEYSSPITDERKLPMTTMAVTREASTVSTSPETVATTAATTAATTTTTESTTPGMIIPETTGTTAMATTSPPMTKPMTTSTTVASTNGEKAPATTTSTPEIYSSVSTLQEDGWESTTDAVSPTVPTEDVTLLIRIVFEGTWHDVCSKLPVLRQALANLVNSDHVEKPITPGQVVFHQTRCSDNLAPASLISEVPLTTVLVYIVDGNGNFDGALTKSLPSLYEKTPTDFPLRVHSFMLVQEADSGNVIAVVIVSCVAFICLILLAGLFFFMRKRQGRFNYGERCRPVSLDAYSLDSVSAYNSVRRSKGALRCSKRSYGNPTFEDSSVIPSHPLNFASLASFCNDENAISEEFAGIPQVSSKIDELPAGAELKNRYANVIPLPETRVPLQRLNNDPLTEYINASYIRGPKNANKYYIGCQAPTESTVSDFWRMIWEQQCKVIIMLTDLVENGVEKCTEYIPPLEVSDCHRLYGDYQVTLKKREPKEKYAISTLHLKNLENNTFREVFHIWYLWPASGAPTDAAGLIAILLEARALQRGAAGSIVVHCSPGTGRTGTLIALDLGIRQYEITRTVDVPRVVYTIRRDRAGAVQTREQYAFIYKGLNLYASKLAGGAIESA